MTDEGPRTTVGGEPLIRPRFAKPPSPASGFAGRGEGVAWRALAICLALALSTPALAFDPFNAARIDDRPGAVVPLDTPVRDAEGRPTTLRALSAGRPLLLVPVQHRCPNICGVTLSGLRDALAGQPFRPGRDVGVVAFGIDPGEGPDAADATLAALGPDRDGFAATVARDDAVRAVTDAVGYRFAWDERIGQYAHLAATAVLTADGRLARWVYGLAPEPTDLRLAVAEAGEGRTGGWSDRLLLLCYRYDPVTGRYTPAITGALQAASALSCLALAGGIGLLLRREKRDGRGTA